MTKNLVIAKLPDIYHISSEFIHKICLLTIDIMISCGTFIGIVCTGRPDISDAGGEPASRNITAWTGPLPEGIPRLLGDVLQRLW